MTPLSLAALATGPGLFLVHVAWTRDRRREPLFNVFLYFLLGAASVFPTGLVESAFETAFLGGPLQTAGAPRIFLWAFLGVALIEELAKLLVVRGRGCFDRHIDEPFDWIVYSVAAALGFATAENAVYVFVYGAETGWVRAFTAVPAHALDGTLMGTRLANAALLTGVAAARQRVLAVVEPLVWHGAYDFPLFLLASETYGRHSALYTLLWIGVVIAQWSVCAARVQVWLRHQRGPTPPVLLPIEIARKLMRSR